MNTGNIKMRAWLSQATAEQRKSLARQSKTSLMHLTHLAKGRRAIGPELAQRLAHAQVEGMPRLDQKELCTVCRACPIAL